MNDVPAALSVLLSLWVFAILMIIGWLPRIVSYLLKLLKLRSLLEEQSPSMRSETAAPKLFLIPIATWLKIREEKAGPIKNQRIVRDAQIDNLISELHPRHRLGAAVFLICLSGLTIATYVLALTTRP